MLIKKSENQQHSQVRVLSNSSDAVSITTLASAKISGVIQISDFRSYAVKTVLSEE